MMMDMMEMEDVNTSSKWIKLLYYLWKIFTCLFLHLLLIATVVGYCYFGMYMFKNLEADYERQASIVRVHYVFGRGRILPQLIRFAYACR